jgi:hypothetical protein
VRAHLVYRRVELREAVAFDPYPFGGEATLPQGDYLQSEQQDANDERDGPNEDSQDEQVDQSADEQLREQVEQIEAQWLVALSGEARKIVLGLRKGDPPVKSREQA